MSLNLHHGKFDYCSPAKSVHAASFAVAYLSDTLWNELRGRGRQTDFDFANFAARRCWQERFAELDNPLVYASSCECVELVLS
jgi:hypothetical protein